MNGIRAAFAFIVLLALSCAAATGADSFSKKRLESAARRATHKQHRRDVADLTADDKRFSASDTIQVERFVLSKKSYFVVLSQIGVIRKATFSRLYFFDSRWRLLVTWPSPHRYSDANASSPGWNVPGFGEFNKFKIVSLTAQRKAIALTYIDDGRWGDEGFTLITASPTPKLLRLPLEEEPHFGGEHAHIYFYDYDRDGRTDIFMDRTFVHFEGEQSSLGHDTIAYRAVRGTEEFEKLDATATRQFERRLTTHGKTKVPHFEQNGGTPVESREY